MNKQYSDTDAERAVLGAVLLDPTITLHLAKEKRLSPDAFSDQKNAIIFRTMDAMLAGGKAIDAMTVMRRLDDKGNIDKAGGREYITGLLDAIPTVTHAAHYLELIIEKQRLRNLAECVSIIPQMIGEGVPSSEVVSRVTSSIVSNVDLGSTESPEDLHRKSMDEFGGSRSRKRAGFMSFLEPVNEIIGSYIPGNVYVIAGRPSDGKSSWAFQELIQQAVEHNIPCAMASLEMSSKLLREMMAGSLSDVSIYAVRNGTFSQQQLDKLRDSFNLLQAAPIFINDKRMTIDEILAWVSYMVARHGVKLFALDYIQLIRPSSYSGHKSRNEEVMEWSAAIKDITKRLNLVTLMVSQLSRAGIRLQDKTPPPPTLEALRDSGSIEQDADAVIMLYKKPGLDCSTFFADADWPMEASVEKHRIGPTGVRPYVFVRRRQKIESLLQYQNRKEREASCKSFSQPIPTSGTAPTVWASAE